jgi:hypothetical protein
VLGPLIAAAVDRAGGRGRVRFCLGRLIAYPWLSQLLARDAPVPADAMLPFDAMVWVTLERQ